MIFREKRLTGMASIIERSNIVECELYKKNVSQLFLSNNGTKLNSGLVSNKNIQNKVSPVKVS
jgi:hypothetical protein